MTRVLRKNQTGTLSGAATVHSDVLRLIFRYLSPVPSPRCFPEELLTHLESILIVAAVNRQWRATAFPTFYRTVYVAISDDGDSYSDDESDDDSVDDQMSAAPSIAGPNVKLCTNIELLHEMGQTGNAREVHIIIQGMRQTADQLMLQLQLAGLGGGKTVWPGIERLRIDMNCSDNTTQSEVRQDFGPELPNHTEFGTGHLHHRALNEFLSRALPALREIEYYAFKAVEMYGTLPINGLIYERLHGNTPLRTLRIAADCGPDVSNASEKKREPDAPVRIERLEIDYSKLSFSISIPPIMVSSLVELKLEPVIVDEVWNHFVSEAVPTSTKAHLLFSSLKTLKLGFASNSDLFFFNRTAASRASDLSSGDGDGLFANIEPRFMRSAKYGQPMFPVLTSLEIRHFPQNLGKFLTLFTASPITSLVICDLTFTSHVGLDLSKFRGLRSLGIRLTDPLNLDDVADINRALSATFSTVNPDLQHLTLAMSTDSEIDESLGIQLDAPPFAPSLRSLSLEGEYGQHDIEHLLQLFPYLHRLNVCAGVGEPITTVPKLVNKYRRAYKSRSLRPLHSTLRVLSAYKLRFFTGFGGSDCVPLFGDILDPEVDNYRGLLVDLVCRLPALHTLRVGAEYMDGVKESIRALVGTKVSPGHVYCLQRLK
ncbi:hypothetical protein GGI09_004070, partial [Coemansia sp. S100]